MSIQFNEQYYLAQNPDVLQYLANTPANQRAFNSAFEHYVRHGAGEGRDPNPYFDTSYYLANNADVLQAYNLGLIDPLTHFLVHGAAEGREPNQTYGDINLSEAFDEDAYLAANADVAAAVEAGTFESAYQHYVLHGQFEDRSGVQLDNGADIPGGDGNTGNTFTLTTASGENVQGTAANDTFQAILGATVAGVNPSTLNTFDTINGGAGNDTLNLIVDADMALPNATIQNVEIINLDQEEGVLANTLTDAQGEFGINAANFVGASQIWQEEGYTNVAGIGANTTVGFRGTDSSAGGPILTFTGATASIALDGVASDSEFQVEGANVTTISISGSVEEADEDTAGTLVITGGSASATSLEDLTTVNLALTNDTVLEIDTPNFGTVETINASASTGGIEASLLGADLALESVTGGSGGDDLTIALASFEAAEVTFDGGAGNDVIDIDASEQDEEATALTITLGAGNDAAVFTGDIANVVDEEDFEESLISITDFNGTADDLNLVDTGLTLTALSNTQQASITAGGATLATALDRAADLASANGGDVVTFVYGEDTYVVVSNDADLDGDADTDGFEAGDGLIQLVGFAGDLTASNFLIERDLAV